MTTTAIDPTALSKRPPMDTDSVPYLGLSAVIHIVFLMIAMVVPPGASHLELDGVAQQDRFVSIAKPAKQVEEDVPDFASDNPDKADKAKGGETTAKHAGEEGAAGTPDATEADKRMAIEGPPDNLDPQIAKQRDEQIARSAGLASVFQNSTSAWAGTSSQTLGAEALDELGKIDGAAVGASNGAFGLGVSDGGRGGGGDDESIGVAVATLGKGGKEKAGGDYGKDEGDLGTKDDRLPDVVPEPPTVGGPLDKEIIQRVVRRHRRELAFCYQNELQQDSTLEGRVVIKFTISGDGSVISALTKSSTMGNRAVEACLSRKIQHWHFPAPSNNALVTVNYPFRFSKK
jgi:TonB family protein